MISKELIHTGLFPAIFGKHVLDNHINPIEEDLTTFAIVDGAKLRELYNKLENTKPAPSYRMLYTGHIANELEEVAPYIIKLNYKSEFTQWLLSTGYAENCILFIKSQKSLNDLAKHFRNYALVNLEQETPDDPDTGFYAFYDPRVVPGHMFGMTATETKQFFEPITSCWSEDIDNPNTLIGYYLGTIHKCHRKHVDLSEVAKQYKIKSELAKTKSVNGM